MSSSGVSFKFSNKVKPSKVQHEKIIDVGKEDDDKDDLEQISHLEGKKIRSANSKKETKRKGPLVIPMMVKNTWLLSDADISEERKLEDAARAALFKDVEKLMGEGEAEDKEVPLLMKNRVPVEFENDERLDVSLRPEQSAEADYDQVPIEEYGMAMLRGMGWKEGDPIGLNTKRDPVTFKPPDLRPKGLGLGADRRLVEQMRSTRTSQKKRKVGEKDEEMTLNIDSAVKIIRGPSRDSYGKVTGFDEDNARVLVKLALGGAVVGVSVVSVQSVSDTEFARDAKCINKKQYDTFKLKQEMSLEGSEPVDVDAQQLGVRSSKRQRTSRSMSPEGSEQKSQEWSPWVRGDLRVRIVDSNYADGKLFHTKVCVVDVVGASRCVCRSDDGRIWDDVDETMLETVIPRHPPMLVMVVRGSGRGEVASILSKDKRQEKATVQLLRQKETVLEKRFDDICEFCGDPSIYDN